MVQTIIQNEKEQNTTVKVTKTNTQGLPTKNHWSWKQTLLSCREGRNRLTMERTLLATTTTWRMFHLLNAPKNIQKLQISMQNTADDHGINWSSYGGRSYTNMILTPRQTLLWILTMMILIVFGHNILLISKSDLYQLLYDLPIIWVDTKSWCKSP